MTNTSPPAEGIAAVISSLRSAKGISANHLAEAAGIAEPTFRRRMRRPDDFSVAELEAVAAKLGTTAADLLTQAQNTPSAA